METTNDFSKNRTYFLYVIIITPALRHYLQKKLVTKLICSLSFLFSFFSLKSFSLTSKGIIAMPKSSS